MNLMQIVMVYFLGSYLRFFKRHLLVKTEKKLFIKYCDFKMEGNKFFFRIKSKLIKTRKRYEKINKQKQFLKMLKVSKNR